MSADVIEQIDPPPQPRQRRTGTRALIIMALALAGVYYATAWSAPSFEDWEVNFEEAQSKAQTPPTRNMLIAFHMRESCGLYVEK